MTRIELKGLISDKPGGDIAFKKHVGLVMGECNKNGSLYDGWTKKNGIFKLH